MPTWRSLRNGKEAKKGTLTPPTTAGNVAVFFRIKRFQKTHCSPRQKNQDTSKATPTDNS